MIRREDFIDAMGMPDEGFERAVDAALQQVRESEVRPVMKRKLTSTLLVAVVTVIVLTGAALAVGFNLFDYFGKSDWRLQAVAPETAVENASVAEVTTDALGVTKARIDSAYYDGQSLIVAYTIDNCQRYESFEPTDAELAEMTEDSDYLLESGEAAENLPDSDEAIQIPTDRKQPFGLLQYSIAIDDHCFTLDGVDLPPSVDTMEDGDGGVLYCIREFETPLPENARNRDKLHLVLPIKLYTSWLYFDGEKYYTKYAQEPVAELTATVNRTEAVTQSYCWEGDLNGVRVSARARVSPVHASIRIQAEGGAFPDPVEIWPDAAEADNARYSFVLTDSRSMEYRFIGVARDEGELEVEFDGLGSLPDTLTLTVRVNGEGEWNAEEHILPASPMTLKPE